MVLSLNGNKRQNLMRFRVPVEPFKVGIELVMHSVLSDHVSCLFLPGPCKPSASRAGCSQSHQ